MSKSPRNAATWLMDLYDEYRDLCDAKELAEEDPENYEFDSDQQERLNELKEFSGWLGDILDYRRRCQSATVIFDSKLYAQEFVGSVYDFEAVPEIIRNNINWQDLADDLMEDYESYSFDGYDFWISE